MIAIPARYSTAEDHRRPWAKRIGHRLKIKLDGVVLPRGVESYDIERGEIIWPVIDRAGHPLRNPRKPDEWLMQTKRGKVEVELGDG